MSACNAAISSTPSQSSLLVLHLHIKLILSEVIGDGQHRPLPLMPG